MRRMSESCVPGDIITFNILLDCLCDIGMIEKALTIVNFHYHGIVL